MWNPDKNVHLIFEGCDAAGKSTLMEALQEKLGLKIVKGSSFEQSECTQNDLFENFAVKLTENINGNIMFDRFIYSNEVYAPLYKDYAILDDTERRTIESVYSFYNSLNAHIIYLYADEEVLASRLNSRGDDYVKAERIPSILASYDKALLKVSPHIGITSFDTTNMSTDEMVEYIVDGILDEMEMFV